MYFVLSTFLHWLSITRCHFVKSSEGRYFSARKIETKVIYQKIMNKLHLCCQYCLKKNKVFLLFQRLSNIVILAFMHNLKLSSSLFPCNFILDWRQSSHKPHMLSLLWVIEWQQYVVVDVEEQTIYHLFLFKQKKKVNLF